MPLKKLDLPPWTQNEAAKQYWREVLPGVQKWTEEGTVNEAPQICPACNNAGFILAYYRRDGQIVGKGYVACIAPNCPTRRAQFQKKYHAVNAASQIPGEYKKMTFAQWDALYQKPVSKKVQVHVLDKKRDALGAAKAFVAAGGNGFRFTRADAAEFAGLAPEAGEGIDNTTALNSMVLSGTYGVGKTSLTCAIANALMLQEVQVVYVRMDNFFMALRDTFNTDKKGDNEGRVIDLYKNAPVLILDELSLHATDWQKETGGALLDYRYANGLPTLITTNIESPEQLRAVWGQLIADRIQAMAHWFVMGGIQLRPRYQARDSR